MTAQEYREQSAGLPHHPGIYKYYDDEDGLLYVGKAKNIRKRVSSYFNKTKQTYKTHELVRRIARIEFTIVNNEQDAFLLENSLIKQFQPPFNINLKDDKTYPFIVIKKEPFQRVFFTRNRTRDGSEYLGPYTSLHKVRELLDFIKQAIPLRTCKLPLTKKNIEAGKFKVCLEYHLGNCKGPCEGLQSQQEYDEGLAQLRDLLKGNLSPVIRHFKDEMKQLSQNLAFEKAAILKKKIEFVENYQSRSIVANSRLGDMDVFSIEKEKDIAFVNYLMVRSGTIVQTHTEQVETHLDEVEVEILPVVILQLQHTFQSDCKELVVPFSIEFPKDGVILTVPKGGDKLRLLELSQKNTTYFIQELKRKERLKIARNPDRVALLEHVQQVLHLPRLPLHIECFDNSNFHGSYPVSAMVCFKNGEPSKNDYRKFNVKTVEGINDFASMKEAVYRRYKRVQDESLPFPQLVIIDGGKGQLGAAVEAMEELGAVGETTLIGLAKNVEEVFFSGDKESLQLPYDDEAHKLLRRIRDEVHRFGITFHRAKRSKGTFKNELEEIEGIGEKTATLLLQQFRSVKRIATLTQDELLPFVNKKKAQIILDYFAKKNGENLA